MPTAALPQRATSAPALTPPIAPGRTRVCLAALVSLWAILFVSSLFSPPVFDDADGTHANAARQMVLSGDWVTLRVNNVRYLEKAPLPYWITAVSLRLFGINAFAAHLPEALGVLALTLLGFRWAREAFGPRAALYTGLATLTSAGVFLFTRIFIPDLLLSLLLATALYTFLKSLDVPPDALVVLPDGLVTPTQSKRPVLPDAATNPGSLSFAAPSPRAGRPREDANRLPSLYPYALWTTLALAILTKGLVALVFLLGTAALYLALTGEYKQWRRLRPLSGTLLMLAIAAPWHILAGLRNTGGMNGHGFFWFYFINEHVLRFLGQRIPRDYNKLPGYLYWSLHLVWLFPWALFLPLGVGNLIRWRRAQTNHTRFAFSASAPKASVLATYVILVATLAWKDRQHVDLITYLVVALGLLSTVEIATYRRSIGLSLSPFNELAPPHRTNLLLALFTTLVLLFFSISTNQEYYTFPAYLPILMLTAAALARTEAQAEANTNLSADPVPLLLAPYSLLPALHAALTAIGFAIAAALAYGLYTSRNLPFVPDIGDLLAHRGVGDYTLSMSALFDLTGPSFAALRLPAALAMAAFAVGPGAAWILRHRRRHLASTLTIALTSATFLIAAHIALVRFSPMLSSHDFAEKIQELEDDGAIARDSTLLLYGDQAYGSSIPFYLNRPLTQPALLVEGRSSSMLFGSTFPDAQHLFLTAPELLSHWGTGPRKLLFVPIEERVHVDRLLGTRPIVLAETSGKVLLTDRPLDPIDHTSATPSAPVR